ncbi:MAG: hypothetical protein IPG84_19725 [Betaproteobacteria bacterium]|nr:hypothetical protein [Betaproteobacteria bacterium]
MLAARPPTNAHDCCFGRRRRLPATPTTSNAASASSRRCATYQSSIQTSSCTNTIVSSAPAASMARLKISGSGRLFS